MKRQVLLTHWLNDTLGSDVRLHKIAGDASFRSFYRIRAGQESLVVMDAPPEKEDSLPFVQLSQIFRTSGFTVPEVKAQNPTAGFYVVSDFGDRTFAESVDEDNVLTMYGAALQELIKLQKIDTQSSTYPFLRFDSEQISKEMDLFKYWLINQTLKQKVEKEDMFDELEEIFLEASQAQPQVVIHRDYHSRNLLAMPDKIGVVDFQDACLGPCLYDVVSLLRDCYIKWPDGIISTLLEQYIHQARLNGIISHQYHDSPLLKGFDMLGLQRHMKAMGIFSRLSLRDNKHGYLKDIPRIVSYIKMVVPKYPELERFHRWLKINLYPHFERI